MNLTLGSIQSRTLQLDEIKQKQQHTWASGNYAEIGSTLQIVGETLAQRLQLAAGEEVLDVAAGNGNFSLAAARCNTRVVSTDYVAALLEKGRMRALADELSMRFEVADAEALPFADHSFDVAASVFGVMFTPDQQTAALELARVVRPGGRIGLASWTPDGFIGQVFKVIKHYVPNKLPSPALWGDAEHVETLFADHAATTQVNLLDYRFIDVDSASWLARFKRVYGPMHKAFAALSESEGAAMSQDLLQVINRFADPSACGLSINSQYAEIILSRA